MESWARRASAQPRNGAHSGMMYHIAMCPPGKESTNIVSLHVVRARRQTGINNTTQSVTNNATQRQSGFDKATQRPSGIHNTLADQYRLHTTTTRRAWVELPEGHADGAREGEFEKWHV